MGTKLDIYIFVDKHLVIDSDDQLSTKLDDKQSDKKKYILTLVLSEKKFLNETKNHNPPLFIYIWMEYNC
jgi:hypothetical protein